MKLRKEDYLHLKHNEVFVSEKVRVGVDRSVVVTMGSGKNGEFNK